MAPERTRSKEDEECSAITVIQDIITFRILSHSGYYYRNHTINEQESQKIKPTWFRKVTYISAEGSFGVVLFISLRVNHKNTSQEE